jgi:hypothetical protein
VNRLGRFATSFSLVLEFGLMIATLLVAAAWAQNPVPQIVGPVKPMAVAPGSGAFTLSVYGANFVPGAVVTWNRQPRTTTFISGHELQAQIPASDVAQNTAGLIGVTNPAPGGGKASTGWAQVEVHNPISTIKVSQPRPYPIGDWLLMAADFNNDGILDLIGELGDLEFYAGQGNGSFRFGSFAGFGYPGVLPGVYGDFNNDGNLDFAFPRDLNVNNLVTHTAVMLGNGKGRFHLGSELTEETGFDLTVVGDFNGDGNLDLVTKGAVRFTVYLGKGDGTFRRFKDYPYSILTTQMATGDFNGDGKLDLLLVQVGGRNKGVLLNVLLGNGDGTLQKPREIASIPDTAMCSAGFESQNFLSDVNGDGKLDIVFCTQTQIVVLLGNGDGTFQKPLFMDAGTQGLFTYALGDINSDGKPDLLVSNYSNFFKPEIDLYLGNGDGTFQAPQKIFGFPFGELGIVPGDFNSDGLLDFIFQTGGGSQAFLQH